MDPINEDTEKSKITDKPSSGLSFGDFDIGVELVQNRLEIMYLRKLLGIVIEKAEIDIDEDELRDIKSRVASEFNDEYKEIDIRISKDIKNNIK